MTLTLWIVDDDEDDRFFLVQALTHLFTNISIKELTDGDQILPALGETLHLPSLILLDLNMTRISGFEILAQLRNSPVYQDLPVVVLTTSDSQQDQERCLLLGANDFLTKQASPHALRALLKQKMSSWGLL